MLFKLSNLNSNPALTLGYLNPALNNSALGGVRLCESEVCHPKRQHNVLCNAFTRLEAVWLSG